MRRMHPTGQPERCMAALASAHSCLAVRTTGRRHTWQVQCARLTVHVKLAQAGEGAQLFDGHLPLDGVVCRDVPENTRQSACESQGRGGCSAASRQGDQRTVAGAAPALQRRACTQPARAHQ